MLLNSYIISESSVELFSFWEISGGAILRESRGLKEVVVHP